MARQFAMKLIKLPQNSRGVESRPSTSAVVARHEEHALQHAVEHEQEVGRQEPAPASRSPSKIEKNR